MAFPRATYRLQFHKDFTFDDAARLAPYLRRLGVSHLYASPLFQAHPGSTHGYDVTDYGTLNPELGGREGYDRLAAALRENGLKLVLDVVPNHMGVGGADNAFWLDLLEWGQEADHAGWFDVDWTPDRKDIRGKVLVPFLGGQYGSVLANGDLRLRFDADDGSFAVWAHGSHKLPICPLHYEAVLGTGHRRLAEIGDAFSDVMRWRPQIMRRAHRLKTDLAEAARDPDVRAAIEKRLAQFNGREGDFDSWSRLAALIDRQNWKAAHFLVASDDINYRRFFNIATLAGIRMELPAVFDHAHSLVFDLMREGTLDGLRIDHVDGLFDTLGYLDRLRRDAPGEEPFYLVVEKILGPDERLRKEWPVQGTTGYDFTNLLTSLFVRQASEAAFTRLYEDVTGERRSFEAIIFDSKLQIIDDEMSSELHRIARGATRVARQHATTADFTLSTLRRALRLLVASFPVYRTYIDGRSEPLPEDRLLLDQALESARTIDRAIDPSTFDFLRRLLTGDLADDPASGYRRSAVFRCAMKLQQYCGPVMAKGVEDTAFYRYNRLVALNEVGGSPDRFGISLDHFHQANRERAEDWPHAMLATSTHDTKRGEDTRARLVALSVMPEAWAEAVERWSAILADHGLPARRPDRNDRYLLFQLMVGTWPADLVGTGAPNPAKLKDFVQRLKDVMTKSLREAKRYSTWTTPDEPYEADTMALIEGALLGPASAAFLAAFQPIADEVARLGAVNTFAQTVLKFTVPGMPDTYQGSEMWDLTMVDPDNRRPVDYAARSRALEQIEDALRRDRSRAVDTLWSGWHDGLFKLALVRLLLDARARHPALFANGTYEPTPVEGPEKDSTCAFVRRHQQASLLVVTGLSPVAHPTSHTIVSLPNGVAGCHLTNLLTGDTRLMGERETVTDLLGRFPAGVWLSET